MGKGHIIGEYNLFCKGQKVVRNREGYDKIFPKRNRCSCANCGIVGTDRYHFNNGVYYCTNCARNNGIIINERHIP